MERLLFVIFFLVIATLVVAPFYLAQRKYSPGNEVINVISYHDLVEHIVVMEQFDKVLRSGVLYPRWLADMNNGYGNAWTNFYPPGFYYLTSSIHFVVDDWLTTLFIASVLALGASGVAMYVLSRTFYGALASGVAALLYMLLPFHLLNLSWQGAMPQFTGFVFLPLVLYFAFRLGKEGRARHYAGLGPRQLFDELCARVLCRHMGCDRTGLEDRGSASGRDGYWHSIERDLLATCSS